MPRKKIRINIAKSLILKNTLTLVIWGMALYFLRSQVNKLSSNEANIEHNMNQASVLFHEGNLNKSLEIFESVNIPEYYPERIAQKYHNIGVIKLKLGDVNNAEIMLKKSLSYNQNNSEACYLISLIAYNKEEYEKSLAWLRKVKKLNPKKEGIEEFVKLIKSKLND
jgi:tetratricopeptide (TPR) repeat protein